MALARVKEGNTVVAIRLRDLRRRRGLTQEELADRAGVEQPQISAWEGGRRTPTLENVRKLARGFDMTHEDLARELGYIEGADDPDRPPAPLPPVILAAWRDLERKHPELIPQLADRQGDPDFAGQIVDLSTALGYVIRGFLGTEIDKPGEG
jgi:transcriptional regulator with XRE-family HTH domain